MTKFIFGIILGFAVATIGVSGVVRIVGQGLNKVQEIAKDADNGRFDASVNQAKTAIKDAAQ